MQLRLTFLLLLFAGTINAQIRKIPADVTDAFAARYPHAQRVSWKDELANFEAEFTLNGFEMSAEFNGRGEWQNSGKKIKFEDLPSEVQDGFAKSKYGDWQKISITEIEKNSQPIQYRIYVKKSAFGKYLYFDANGKLLREALKI